MGEIMTDKAELQARLEFWKSALSELRSAYLALIGGGVQSYTIDIPSLKNEIAEAEKKVDELSALLKGQRPRKAFGIIPRDW